MARLVSYDLAHPRPIHTIAGSGECKILLYDFDRMEQRKFASKGGKTEVSCAKN